MIERSIVRKVEEAKTQGWRQLFLSRFLETSFRLAKACGLTDIVEETTDMLLTKEGKNWSEQMERLIGFGFHSELGMDEDEYRATIPAFQPQPPRYKGRFDVPLLIDPRVSLQRQLDLHKVIVNPQITEADLTRLSLKESTKPHIPKEPYQLWIKADLRTFKEAYRSNDLKLRNVQEFTYDERGLTAIEGLAILREVPNILYNGFPNLDQDGMYLLDSGVGENKALTLKPLGHTRLPGQVAALTINYASEHTCSYNLISCAKLPKR
ncbi:hypothetical protein HYU94_02265 [Candidatus Daviesbacteria bacterium]|nr:hypothetical protein [Candidatus Daviesbacteria bacterium]